MRGREIVAYKVGGMGAFVGAYVGRFVEVVGLITTFIMLYKKAV